MKPDSLKVVIKEIFTPYCTHIPPIPNQSRNKAKFSLVVALYIKNSQQKKRLYEVSSSLQCDVIAPLAISAVQIAISVPRKMFGLNCLLTRLHEIKHTGV